MGVVFDSSKSLKHHSRQLVRNSFYHGSDLIFFKWLRISFCNIEVCHSIGGLFCNYFYCEFGLMINSVFNLSLAALKRMLNFNAPPLKNTAVEPVWKVITRSYFSTLNMSSMLFMENYKSILAHSRPNLQRSPD